MSPPRRSRIVVTVESSPMTDADAAARQAWADAGAAADASGVSVRELAHSGEHHAAEQLLCRVWSAEPGQSLLPAHVTRTMSLIGGYAAGAYDGDGELLGTAVGFLTGDTAALGPAHLHSHIVGVAEAARGRHVGFALKLHQRAWALSRGIDRVTWTFDPLVARNAYFNLVKLGARATAYLADFYGDMDDGINAGQGSDRLLAQWHLCSPSAVQAIHGRRTEPDPALIVAAGQVLVRPDERGAPLPAGGARTGQAVCAIPADIELMRRADPGLALAWRHAVRAALGGAMHAGHRITGFARSGWYLLEPVPPHDPGAPQPAPAPQEAAR